MSEEVDGFIKGLEGGLKQRASYVQLVQKKPEITGGMSSSLKALEAALESDSSDKQAINTLLGDLKKAEDALLPHVDAQTGRFNGTNFQAYEEASDALRAVKVKLHDFFSGKEVEITPGTKQKASSELQTLYKTAVKGVDGVSRALNHVLADVTLRGPKATAERNLKFWDNAVTEGRKTAVFARAGGVALGAAMAGDALLRSRESDDTKRSGVTRLTELAAGLGIAGASAFAGAAR